MVCIGSAYELAWGKPLGDGVQTGSHLVVTPGSYGHDMWQHQATMGSSTNEGLSSQGPFASHVQTPGKSWAAKSW